MTRIMIWATHLQTDILALAAHLDACPDVALLIVAADAVAFRRTPVAAALALAAPVLDRGDSDTLAQVRSFSADIVVADNHVPPKGVAPRLFYMWHGLGWKARSRLDLAVFYRQVKRLTGIDPRCPNPRFLAQCYGPTDRAWRSRNWNLPADACPEVGMAFAALLRDPPYSKDEIAANYAIDVIGRKTVLLAITWHSGDILRGGAADLDLVRTLIATTGQHGANLLVCFHDRQRYDAAFVADIERLIASLPHCELRFKSDYPDNLSDLLVADVMVSNLSSFLVYYYVLGRPAIHIVPERDKPIERVTMLFSRFRIRRKITAEAAWMIDPADTGGVRVHDRRGAASAVVAALADPRDGGRASKDWLARHVPRSDCGASQRIKVCLEAMCSGTIPLIRPGGPRKGWGGPAIRLRHPPVGGF